MQILSKNFSLPKDIKNVNNQSSSKLSNPNFKSSKTKIAEELSSSLTKHLSTDAIKDIFSNPKKKNLFLEILGATIVSTVANIVNLMGGEEKVEENLLPQVGVQKQEVDTKNKDTQVEKTQSLKKETEVIKFERLKGTTPKIENDFQNYVNENFADDNITSDRLKLLFNKFGGSNRKKVFLYEDLSLKSGEILTFILDELKNAKKDTEKINSIINIYQNIQSIDNIVPSKIKKEVSIDIPKDVSEIINRYPKIKEKYNEIIKSSKTKEEAKERTKIINDFIHPDIKDLNKETLKKARQNINKNYTNILENLSLVASGLPEYDKVEFYTKIANKEILEDAILTWNKNKNNSGVTFSLYNNLHASELSEENISKIIDLICCGQVNSININPENKDFKIALPSIKSLNRNFKTIVEVFSLIKNEQVNLKAEEHVVYDKETIIEDLKKDYFEHGKTTYPNIIKYLYKNNHEINGEWDFDKRHVDYRFNFLIEALNNEKLFNPQFFSNHCKLRFIERFVLNQDFGEKRFENAIRTNIRKLIESIKTAIKNGVDVTTYSNEYVNGVQLTIPTEDFGDVKITLDNGEKIHTIF